MRFQLNGSVEISFKASGSDEPFALYFEAEDFQGIAGDGITTTGGKPAYTGWLDAVEDNIQVRLWIATDGDAFREKRWEIESIRTDVRELKVDRDDITFEFVD